MATGDERGARRRLRRLVGRRANTPLRRVAQAWMAGTPLPPGAVDAARSALTSVRTMRWKDRATAALLLGRLPIYGAERESVRELLEYVLADTVVSADRGCRLRRLVGRSLMTSLVLSFFCVVLSPALSADISYISIVWLAALALFVLVGAPISSGIETLRIDAVRAAAAESLGMTGDRRSAAVLAMAALDRGGDVRAAALVALEHVLPALRPADYGAVGAVTVRNLGQILGPAGHTLALVVLDALEKVGGGSAVPFVERYARATLWPEARAAAERILPVLRARQAKERDASRLLRAAEPANAPADVLLRPGGAGESDPALLLRAAVDGGREEDDDGE